MKITGVYVLICIMFFLSGCSRNESSDEIRIKKNEVSSVNNNTKTESSGSGETKPVIENTSLKKISSKEARRHVGDSVTIRGYIADVYLGEKVAYLNFEDKFPKNDFSCVIFPAKFEEFGDLSKYKNKTAEITGRIKTYKSKPQIILESKEQLKIIQ